MEAIKCKECGKGIEQKHAGRPKQFCSISCRSNFWQKEKRKEAELYRAGKKLVQTGFSTIGETAISKVLGPTDPQVSREMIVAEIAAVKAEKIPVSRDTILGRKSWATEQQKRISDLQDKLK